MSRETKLCNGFFDVCGISGAFGAGDREGIRWVEHINGAQEHRGPDNAVVVSLGPVVLGNTRLAVQEPSPAGNQPFASTDGRYVAVFNGEIYNHGELAEEHRVRTASRCDGEIIPHLWSQFGLSACRLFRGMYAIAVADTLRGTLTLARDRFGIKPLFWRRFADGAVAFASEVRPLVAIEQRPSVQKSAVARFLYLGALGSDEAPFDSVYAVAPNTTVTFTPDGSANALTIDESHLRAQGNAPLGSAQDLAAQFRRSVELHLGADVPTALLLSAGVDSSALAAVAADAGHKLHCLTVVGRGMGDESELAARTARHYGHTHESVEATLTPDDLDMFFHCMQRPTVDGLNTYLVSKAVREAGFKVALSGLGGDEALGGYSHARMLRYLPTIAYWRRLPKPLRVRALRVAARAVPRMASPKTARLLAPGGPTDAWGLSLLQREVFFAEDVRRLCGVDPRGRTTIQSPAEVVDLRSHRALASAEAALYMQAMLLPDTDAFSMAWSIEMRVPFVDWPFFDAALRLGDAVGIHFSKRDLIASLGDPYLMELSRRPKTGFTVPMTTWMTDGTFGEILGAAGRADSPLWQTVDRRYGNAILARHDNPRWTEPWALCVLHAWLSSL